MLYTNMYHVGPSDGIVSHYRLRLEIYGVLSVIPVLHYIVYKILLKFVNFFRPPKFLKFHKIRCSEIFSFQYFNLELLFFLH